MKKEKLKPNKCKNCGELCEKQFCCRPCIYEYKNKQSSDSEKLQRRIDSFKKYFNNNKERLLKANRDRYYKNKAKNEANSN